MTAPTRAVTVDRAGTVTVNGRRVGHVDRWIGGYDRLGQPKTACTWRWITEGGQQSPVRYPTRAAALAALVQS